MVKNIRKLTWVKQGWLAGRGNKSEDFLVMEMFYIYLQGYSHMAVGICQKSSNCQFNIYVFYSCAYILSEIKIVNKE